MTLDSALPQRLLGDTSLFLGAQTKTWTLTQFDQAAQFAVAHGVDTLLVKVFDGANDNVGSPDDWYTTIGGYAAVASTLLNRRVTPVPYGYLYGDSKGSVLADELNLCESYLNTYGCFCADIEAEWNGRVDWATTLNQRLSQNTNILLVSSLADPSPEQNLAGVYQAMVPAVNAFLPQNYDAFLNSVESNEYSTIRPACVIPTYDLDNAFGPNDPVAYVTLNGGPVVLWEYTFAQANPALLDHLVSIIKGKIMKLTATGEVLALNQADQFQPGKSQFECGYFACAMVRSGAAPGHIPIRTVQQVIDDGEMWYGQYDGSTDISNTNGMSLPQLYALIKQMTYDYRPINIGAQTLPQIRAWLSLGFPVIVAGMETGFFDLGLGDVVPYPWTPAGSHVIVFTGVTADGNFLVRDSANVTDLYNPNTLRPGPRTYDASKLQLISATAVVMPWLPKPPAGFDPTKGTLTPVSTIPHGWTDDGKALHNPVNSNVVTEGFRNYILTYPGGWEAWNVPLNAMYTAPQLEESNPALGGGNAQDFRNGRLEWLPSKQKVIEGWTGQELVWYRAHYAPLAAELASVQGQVTGLEATVAKLTAEVATLTATVGGITPQLQAAINTVVQELTPFVK